MPKSLSQLNAQIEKLQREAEQLKAREKAEVVGRIREAIAHYGISAAELGLTGRGNGKAAGPARGRGRPRKDAVAPTPRKARKGMRGRPGTGVVKFRDDQGNSWTGHGKRPNWYKAALAAGKSPEDLLVKN